MTAKQFSHREAIEDLCAGLAAAVYTPGMYTLGMYAQGAPFQGTGGEVLARESTLASTTERMKIHSVSIEELCCLYKA